MAILAIHPAKNKPIAFKIVNVVIGSAALSGLKKAVIATRIAATINKTMCLPLNDDFASASSLTSVIY